MKEGKLKLKKSPNKLTRMKKRWVVLSTNKIQLYSDKSMRKPVLAIWLSAKMKATKANVNGSNFAFCISGGEGMLQSLLFCSKSEEESTEWINTINTVISEWKGKVNKEVA